MHLRGVPAGGQSPLIGVLLDCLVDHVPEGRSGAAAPRAAPPGAGAPGGGAAGRWRGFWHPGFHRLAGDEDHQLADEPARRTAYSAGLCADLGQTRRSAMRPGPPPLRPRPPSCTGQPALRAFHQWSYLGSLAGSKRAKPFMPGCRLIDGLTWEELLSFVSRRFLSSKLLHGTWCLGLGHAFGR